MGSRPSQSEPASSANAEGGDVNEIVVTAQGRVQRLRDVPISASVIGGPALEAGNLKNLAEVTERMPAVKITPAPASDLINIRGIGSGLNAGFEQSVATFVDGVYRGRSRTSRAALFDVDRVEVLKGPQTTFFGNNAIAGALNITTRKAELNDQFKYNGTLLYAPTDDEFAIEAGLNVPLGENLALRVAGKYFGMNGYVKNTHLGKDGPHQRDFVSRASLAWQASSTLRTDLRVDYGRFRDTNAFPSETIGCPTQPPYPAPRGQCARYLAIAGANADGSLNGKSNGGASRFKLDYVEVTLNNRLDIGDHTLRSITSYYDHDVTMELQLIPLPLPGVGGRSTPFPTSTAETYHSFSQEFRLESPTGQTLEYALGAYYSKDHLDAPLIGGYYYLNLGAQAPGYTTADTPIARRFYLRQNARTLSAFAAATLRLGDSFRINGGLRYSVVHKRAYREGEHGIGQDVTTHGFVPLPLPAQVLISRVLGVSPANFTDPTRTDKKLMPSVSVQYDVTSGVMAYASYTKGFKAGGYAQAPNPDTFGPEFVDAYEIGLKGALFDNKLTFSLAAYTSTYDNLQESTNVTLPSGIIQAVIGNVAQARSKGIELGVTGRVLPGLTLNADVGYLDAYYIRYPGAPCTILQALSKPGTCFQDLSGGRRAYSPKFSGGVGANIVVPVSNLQLRIDPSMYFSSWYYQQASAEETTIQKGFAKYDLRIALSPEDRHWEVAIIGKNLSDKLTGSFRNGLPSSPGTTVALPDRPRSVALQFTFRN